MSKESKLVWPVPGFWSRCWSGLASRSEGSVLEHAEEVTLCDDEVLHAVELDLDARVLAEENAVPGLHAGLAELALIVVSSTWRITNTVEQILDFLHRRGAPSAKIIGVTPSLTGYRGEEIRAYLKEHPEITLFSIVDDGSDMEPYYDRLVQTHMSEGMLDVHVERLVALLHGIPT